MFIMGGGAAKVAPDGAEAEAGDESEGPGLKEFLTYCIFLGLLSVVRFPQLAALCSPLLIRILSVTPSGSRRWTKKYVQVLSTFSPDLFFWNCTRVLPKNPPVPDAHREWRTRQHPVYHQYHKNVYRYRFRKPRYVQWDGSMNQPVMPYMHDNGTDVANGTFKRNCNTVP